MPNERRRLSRRAREQADAALRELASELAGVMADAGGTAAMARCFVDGKGRVTVAWNLYTAPATVVSGAVTPVCEGREELEWA